LGSERDGWSLLAEKSSSEKWRIPTVVKQGAGPWNPERKVTADELNVLADFYGSKNGYSAMRKFGSYMAIVTPALEQEVERALRQIQKK